MSDDFNFDIMQNEAELEKLCTDSVDLINYARNECCCESRKYSADNDLLFIR